MAHSIASKQRLNKKEKDVTFKLSEQFISNSFHHGIRSQKTEIVLTASLGKIALIEKYLANTTHNI